MTSPWRVAPSGLRKGQAGTVIRSQNPTQTPSNLLGGANTGQSTLNITHSRNQTPFFRTLLNAFRLDLEKKIGIDLNQEIDLCRGFQDRSRVIDGLPAQDVTRWLFVIVVTDPFPSLAVLSDSLRM